MSKKTEWTEKLMQNIVASTSLYFNNTLQQSDWKCNKCKMPCQSYDRDASHFNYLCLTCIKTLPQNQIDHLMTNWNDYEKMWYEFTKNIESQHSIDDIKEK